MEANKILSADILDIVFEDRNKEYGAYQLRKSYNKRILMALGITGSIALLALVGSILASTLKTDTAAVEIKEVTIQDLKQEEEIKEIPPPPPPKPPDPPKIEMKQFTPPKIVKDEEVEEPPPAQEELKEAKIDVVNQEGIKDEGIAAPVEIDQGKQIIEEKKEDDNHIFEKVEIEASFKGGEGAWKKYLERNLNPNAPVDNGAPEGTYTVYVQFVVSKDGTISDVKALTNHGYGMEGEAMRVIKKGPAWVPAVQNGRSVNAYRKQPITFQVTSE
ncbi:MAG: energy transducer TonB [Chitinophagaceae bacterium]|nr:energy transducer TonB [Chitinophagaceae bacterium]